MYFYASRMVMVGGLDFVGVVDIECAMHCVACQKCGVATVDVLWVYSRNDFARQFDLTVAWLVNTAVQRGVAVYAIDYRPLAVVQPKRCVTCILNVLCA